MNKVLKGKFYALEGGEATGKTTTSKALKDLLTKDGYEVIITREPGGIPSAESIRDNIMSYTVDSKTELLLYLASRREHLVKKVIPALEEGKIVICDRFYLSSLAYQGCGRELGIETVRELNDFVCEGILPALNILIDIPVQVSKQRKAKVKDINRLDLENDSFHNRVREGYRLLVQDTRNNIVVVDGTQEKEDMINEIYHIIKNDLDKSNI